MFLRGRGAVHPGAASPSALDDLLATEQEIATQLATAEQEAAALLAAARADAEAIDRDAAAALAAELAALDTREAASRAELVRALEQESARLVTHYGSLSEADVASLASVVVHEVTGLTPEVVA